MSKSKLYSKLVAVLAIAVIGVAGAKLLSGANAQTLAINVNMNWIDGASSCYGTANGQYEAYYGAVKGDTVNVHIANVSAYSIDVTAYGVSSSGIKFTIPAGTSIDKSWTANSEITLENDGGPCTSGHGGPGIFYIKAATGNISCTLSDNQVWTIQLGYYSLTGNASLYRGSSLVYPFNVNSGNLLTSVQFAATSSATTYKLYYGSTNSTRLLGQATCPAKSITTSASSSSSSSGSGSSTPTTSTPAKSTKSNDSTSTGTADKSNDSLTASDSSSAPASSQDSSDNKRFSPYWLALPIVGLPLLAFGLYKYYPKLSKTIRKKH